MSSEPTLNDRQRKFVEAIARGESAQDAARSAGYSPGYIRKASRLLKQPLIAKEVAEIREQGRTLAAYDLAAAMKEAEAVCAFAKQHKNAMAYCKATELRAKLSGLLIDKVEVVTVDLKGALLDARTRVFGPFDITPKPSAALADMRPTAIQGNGTPAAGNPVMGD
jgi:hypothetical protein